MIKFIKSLNNRQALVKYENRHFLVSESKPDSPVRIETLVFECDESGNVIEWVEVDGEIGTPIKDFLPRLLARGYFTNLSEKDDSTLFCN